MKKDGESMSVVEKAAEMLGEENKVVVIGGDAETPESGNAAITTTTTDQVEDPEKVVNINIDKLKNVDDQTIIDACEEMVDIDDSRSNLNDQASNIRSKLRKLGVPTASFNAAYARFKKTEKQRSEQDAGYAKCCRAMGVQFQPGLF